MVTGRVVSGFPAPPLGKGSIGEGGSEQPHRLPRVPCTGRKTTVLWTLKVGKSKSGNTRPPLDRGWQTMDGWRASRLVEHVGEGSRQRNKILNLIFGRKTIGKCVLNWFFICSRLTSNVVGLGNVPGAGFFTLETFAKVCVGNGVFYRGLSMQRWFRVN